MVLKVRVILIEHCKGKLTSHDSPSLEVNGKAIARHERHSPASMHIRPWGLDLNKSIDHIPSGDLESHVLDKWTEGERLYLVTPKHPKPMDHQEIFRVFFPNPTWTWFPKTFNLISLQINSPNPKIIYTRTTVRVYPWRDCPIPKRGSPAPREHIYIALRHLHQSMPSRARSSHNVIEESMCMEGQFCLAMSNEGTHALGERLDKRIGYADAPGHM